MHPINLTLRFLLELAMLFSLGYWGYHSQPNWTKYLFAIGLPLLAAVLWGTFAVPDDPSRSGKTVFATPGSIRLVLELGLFAFAVWALYDVGWKMPALAMGILVIIHYLWGWERIVWLLKS